MLTSHISTVLRQAVLTFTNRELFHQNMELLKAVLDKTTAADVNLHPQFMTPELWQREKKAPVTYVEVYEDSNLTIGIFILKPNMKMPLHNHPQMHGLIKVLGGQVKITSYSANTPKLLQVDRKDGLLTVERSADMILEAHNECCVLGPELRNLHEIESGEGPAAFLDILAPPYETPIGDGNVRKCSYYKVFKEITPSISHLIEIGPPSWYWSDKFPYTGPELS